MSRIFDALRRSEKELQQEAPLQASVFLETMEKSRHGLAHAPVERAVIPPDNRLVVYSDPHSPGAERFRLLRARLQPWQTAKKLKTLLITSALPQEGKSLVAVNLATALARQEGRAVLLLEGDLRRSSLRPLMKLSGGPGLTQCLEEGSDPFKAVRRIEPLGFYLLAAGPAPANPVELLQSQRFADLMRALVSSFDWILMDSPPVEPLADTPVLKTQADASLLVVRAGRTPREAVQEAVQVLGPEHLIGLILNGAENLEQSYYHYYTGHGGSGNGRGGSRQDRGSGL